jgi:hypothetical protein
MGFFDFLKPPMPPNPFGGGSSGSGSSGSSGGGDLSGLAGGLVNAGATSSAQDKSKNPVDAAGLTQAYGFGGGGDQGGGSKFDTMRKQQMGMGGGG